MAAFDMRRTLNIIMVILSVIATVIMYARFPDESLPFRVIGSVALSLMLNLIVFRVVAYISK